MAAKEYNGHHCWTCWNVALWLGNDEGLYNAARWYWDKAVARVARGRTRRTVASIAASNLVADLPKATPDGARYSLRAVRAALLGLFGDE